MKLNERMQLKHKREDSSLLRILHMYSLKRLITFKNC